MLDWNRWSLSYLVEQVNKVRAEAGSLDAYNLDRQRLELIQSRIEWLLKELDRKKKS